MVSDDVTALYEAFAACAGVVLIAPNAKKGGRLEVIALSDDELATLRSVLSAESGLP